MTVQPPWYGTVHMTLRLTWQTSIFGSQASITHKSTPAVLPLASPPLKPTSPVRPQNTASSNYTALFVPLQPSTRPQAAAPHSLATSSAFSSVADSGGAPFMANGAATPQPMTPPSSSQRPMPAYASAHQNGSISPLSVKPPPGWQPGLMQPTRASKPPSSFNASKNSGWDDFDPLK